MLAVALAAAAQALAGEAPAATPAEWRPYAVLVDFRDLPRTYSCDELWYKFRDVLRKLGARAYMTITPYHCGVRGGGAARSPSVEVKFQLPQPLHGAAVRYAEIATVEQLVRFSPGSPPSLAPADCELVRQMQQGLLAALPLRVSSAEFRCTGAAAAYALTLDAAIAATPAGQPSEAAAASHS
jgi:hypothetical protein